MGTDTLRKMPLGSQKVVTPALDRSFAIPPTVEGLGPDGLQLYDQFPSNEQIPASMGGTLFSWDLNANTRGWTVPAECFILLRGFVSITKDFDPYNAVTPVGLTATTSPVLSASMFDNVEIQFDDTIVVQSEGSNQPWCHLASVIMNESWADRQSGDLNRGYILDAPMMGAYMNANRTGLSPAPNPEAMKRSDLYIGYPGQITAPKPVTSVGANTRQFDIVVRLSDLGFRCNDWIPPGVTIRVRARGLPEGFRFQGVPADLQLGATGIEPLYTLSARPTFYVSRRMLDAVVHESMVRQWRTVGITMPYQRVRSVTASVPAGQQSCDITNVFPGRCPTSVVAFFVRESAYNGNSNWDNPPFALAPPGVQWRNTRIQVGGGRFYPIMQLNTQPGQLGPHPSSLASLTLTTGELYQLYLKSANSDPFLRESDFTNIQPVVFPIQEQMRAAGLLNFGGDTAITFHTEFTAPPEDAVGGQFAWKIILIAFSDRLLSIHADGSINPDA